jgi:hypothetical protein
MSNNSILNGLKTIAIGFTIIATLSFAIGTLFGTEQNDLFSFINKEEYWTNMGLGTSIYKLDVNKYLKNIELTMTNIRAFDFKMPEMYEITNWTDTGKFFINILNVLIAIFNIAVYPLQVAGYIILNVLGALGINTGLDLNNPAPESGIKWLIDVATYLTNNGLFPYVRI